jgi:glyoxylase-like metal-dependent hydrolase (beta-lactamase superfamily II)
MNTNTLKTNLDRRRFIRNGAAALAGAALVPAVASSSETNSEGDDTDNSHQRSPGFYRFALNEVEITVYSDGFFNLPAEIFAFNVDPDIRDEYFHSRLIPSDWHPYQASPVVIDNGNHRILVDSGTGDFPYELFSDDDGLLAEGLQAAGISPGSIDMVILTHAHPDHLGGLVHPNTQEPFFPNAEIVLSDVELDFWTGDDVETRISDAALPMLPGIQAVLASMDGRLRPIRAGDEVVSGIRSIASPGHTHGHIAIGLEAGSKELLLVGDAITNIHIDFEHPDWHFGIDLEPETAGKTRRRLLDMAATDDMLILGYHFPFPGIGKALRYRNAWRWYPAGWTVLP